MKQYGCITCHVIPGVTAAKGAVGPALTNFGDRTFIAGRLRNEPENLVLWIQHPQRVRPGTAMPELGVSDTDARHIAAYLYTLSSNRGGPPFIMPTSTRPGH
jgi:cytochrome c